MSSRPSRGAARLAAILDALPDGLVLVNANGTVVNANTIALEMFETPGTALVGRGLLDLLPEFDSKLIPGSMRRPDSADSRGRTKPTRMTARRTDGGEFPAEVTSASLEDGRDAYNDSHSYTGDELLMLVVRDLSGTVDTEAELARSQRQTEMILRAASEGVVGTDTDGRVVLVNPAAAQILGFRATDLGGRELHTLILHSRADGEPFPYADSPLADTLRSGRKHRVRGQVLWAKNGKQVPVDLTTAPVRDGDQLVGAVMTFTDRRAHEELVDQHNAEVADARKRHAKELAETTERLTSELAEAKKRLNGELAETTERLTTQLDEATERHAAELADRSDRYAAEIEELAERYGEVAARHAQLSAVLGEALRGPLEELRGELAALAADPAGQLWPEANQILHHLAAGYARMTTLVDNVLGYQRLDAGTEQLNKTNILLDGVVAAGVEGAIELIGPGRAQFAVHAPPIEAEVDPGRLAQALAHLIADVAGVDSTGRARVVAGGGYVDSTIVVAAAQRGDVVRIEVRGPFAGGDPVHEPLVRGIVRAHGGVLQTHEMPGMSGSAYVLELPLGEGAGTIPVVPPAPAPVEQAGGPAGPSAELSLHGGAGQPSVPEQQGARTSGGGRRRARRASTDAFLDAPAEAADAGEPTGRRRARTEAPQDLVPGQDPGASGTMSGPEGPAVDAGETGHGVNGGTGRRRGRPSPAEDAPASEPPPVVPTALPGSAVALPSAAPSEGSVVTSAEGAHPTGRAALGQAVPPRGVPVDAASAGGTGRRARHGNQNAMPALTAGPSAPAAPVPPPAPGPAPTPVPAAMPLPVPQQSPPGAVAPPPAPSPAAPPAVPPGATPPGGVPAGRRARRALAPVQERHTPVPPEPEGGRSQFALPPAEADRTPASAPRGAPAGPPPSRFPSVPTDHALRGDHENDHTPPQPHPLPSGRRRARQEAAGGHADDSLGLPVQLDTGAMAIDPNGNQWGEPEPVRGGAPAAGPGVVPDGQGGPTASGFGPMTGPPGWPEDPSPAVGDATGRTPVAPPAPAPAPGPAPAPAPVVPPPAEAPHVTAAEPAPTPPGRPAAHQPLPLAQPLPEEAPLSADSTQGRAFSVRTLGQGVPFTQQPGPQQHGPASQQIPAAGQTQGGQGAPSGLAPGRSAQAAGQPHAPSQAQAPAQGPSQPGAPTPGAPGLPAPQGQSGTLGSGRRRKLGTPPDTDQAESGTRSHPQGSSRLSPHSEGRSYEIGAPDEGAEGPQPLDGPGGAVEVANRPQPQPVDDELPPEPLDNPRRLLVWPAPDVSTSQALSDRGYRPVVVHSREEVDAQIAAFPAALFVDPLTGPITRTALQSLRQAAVAAEVPVLVTAGLGQATREAAYGADPAVLLKALAPRDSEQHPSRVLLVEEQDEIALALTATLERRGMQVARAATDDEAVALAGRARPNLVVMDLMQVRRRRAGIVDWLRANGQLNRTPLVVYTSIGIDPAELPRLSSGETVLFLAERSTSDEVQARIVELLAKIGTN